MKKAPTLFAFIAGLIIAIFADGQTAKSGDARWREIMQGPAKERSLEPLREALKIAEQFGEADPRLFETLVRLSGFCEYDDDCEDAEPGYINRALKMRSKVKPQDARYAGLLMDLAGVVSDQTRHKEALDLYREALDIREKVFGAHAEQVAEVYAGIAQESQAMGDKSQARTTMNYALQIRQEEHQDQNAEFADLLDDSARLYRAAGEAERAKAEYEREIAIRERIWGRSDARLIASLQQIAEQNGYGTGTAFAETLYKRIADLEKDAHGGKSEGYYAALVDLAQFLRFEKRYREAEENYQRALEVREQMGKRDMKTAEMFESIARCRLERGMYKEAAEAGEASLAVRANLEKPGERETAGTDALLAEAYLRAYDRLKAEAYFQKIYTHVGRGQRYLLTNTAKTLSQIYEERGDYQSAAGKLELVVASREAGNAADPQLVQDELRLARLYQLAGRPADANRMNMAAMMTAGRNAQAQSGGPQQMKKILLVMAVIFLVAPFVGTIVFGLLFGWMARRTDRRLALEYAKPVEAEVVDEAAVVEGSAFVGGFLHLTPALGMEAVAAPVASPAIELPEQSVGGGAAVAMQPAAEVAAEVMQATPDVPETKEQPCSQVALHADGSDLFAMRVLNLLLSLVTFGIYSFWGKAKVRRYVCGQADYQGDWFAFHGTGRELLLGWLRALPALGFIFLFPSLLPLFWQNRFSGVWAQLASVTAFALLWPVARVGAYRYRLNRLSWRAIRLSYRGRALRYFGESVLGGLLCVVTLGLYVPFFHVRLRRLLINQTYFGNQVFRFTGRAWDLMPAWLFGLPLTVCTLGIGFAWWRALAHRYCWAHTTFGGSRFRCTATGAKLLWLWIGNFLVIVPTLGFGMSWATLRTLRFWTKHIQLVGEPELTQVAQDDRTASAVGESFADFLGFDFGF